MRNKQSGFTLLEMLIAIAILGIIMAMNSTLLQDMIRSVHQQGSLVTSQFETALGLDVLRNDLGNAGYGLPESFLSNPSGLITDNYEDAVCPTAKPCCYSEPAGHADNPAAVAAFNDCPLAPRALVIDVNNTVVNAHTADGYLANSDYLVIRSPAVGMNKAAGKWTYISACETCTDYVHIWNDPSLDMENNNRMIVVKARATVADTAQLVINSVLPLDYPRYSATYNGKDLTGGTKDEDDFPGFRPPVPPTGDRYIAYGVDNSALSMPFNRADYYVRRRTGTTGLGCAPGTGTLFKAVAKQAGGGFFPYSIMDCVANMQVVFGLDEVPLDGVTNIVWKNNLTDTDNATLLNALQIKERVTEIRVYILAHEGTFDRGYRHDSSIINPVPPPNNALGQSVNLSTLVTDGNWDHYRWKTYTLSVKPRSFY